VKVPHADMATVTKEKITGYLLNLAHPQGGPKAVFFLRFGFTAADWEVMAAALRLHVHTHEIVRTGRTVAATTYAVVGALITPDGRNPSVRTTWHIRDGEMIPRFSRAYSARK